jgi:hypothetical protein
MVLTSLAVRYKFQGMRALQIWRIKDTLVFLVFPFWYLYWFVRGCFRYGSFGALV